MHPFEHSELHQQVLDALAPGGAWFFRQLSDAVGSTDDRALSAALWELVWAGRVSNDTLTPLRALTRGGRATHRTKAAPARPRMASTTGGRMRVTGRTGPPETAGRWALLPTLDTDPTRRAHATAERLLDRHGVVIRGAVMSERTPGRLRRGVQGAVGVRGDRPLPARLLRRRSRRRPVRHRGRDRPAAHVQRDRPGRQADRALPRRDRPGQPLRRGPPLAPATSEAGGHRPGRKAGALVVLVDGELTLYVERGGRTLLTWSDDLDRLGPAAEALADAARRGSLGRLTVESADGTQLLGSGSTPVREALQGAGFLATPRGLRLRSSTVPEGDTVFRAARLLDRALTGRVLTASDFRVPQHATADLSGGTVVGTVSRGKHLLTRVDRGPDAWTLHTHLKMEGAWRVLDRRPALATPRPPGPGRPHHRRQGRGRLLARRRRAPRARRRGARPSVTSARTCSAPTGTPTRPYAACWPSRTARCARRCSTSATSPGSATCTPPSCASSAVCTRGPRSARCPTCAGWCCARTRCSTSTRSGRSSPRPGACASASGCGSTAGTGRRAGAAAPRSRWRCRARRDGTRASYWCPSCQPLPPAG